MLVKIPNDGPLMKAASELNIWIHAYSESFGVAGQSEFGQQLNRLGDSVSGSFYRICDYRGSPSKQFLLKDYLKIQDSVNELANQLQRARHLNCGDEKALVKAEALCEEMSNLFPQAIQFLSAED
jgi:hypothetical protein